VIAARELLRKQLPVRTTPVWQYGGMPIDVDPAMTGEARFAARVDAGIGTISSRLSIGLKRRASAGDSQLFVAALPTGIVNGAMFDVDRREQVIITSFQPFFEADGSTTYVLNLDAVLIGNYAVETRLNYIAFPATVVRAAKAGSIEVIVDADTFIVPGDRAFTVSRPMTTLVSTPETTVLSVTKEAAITQNRTRWRVTMSEIVEDISVNSYIYFRAFVAYRSARVPLPSMSGPYVFDVAGGKTFGLGSDKLSVTAEFHNYDITTSTAGRNEVGLTLPIRAGDACLWRFEYGYAMPRSLDQIELNFDDEGQCAFGFELPMPAQLEIDWLLAGQLELERLIVDGEVAFESNEASNIRWTGTAQRVVLVLAGGARAKINVSTNPIRRGYRSMSYSYVANTHTAESWSGGHLMLKPLLKQLGDSVACNADHSALVLNSGGFIL
jgi:hypothetical protein